MQFCVHKKWMVMTDFWTRMSRRICERGRNFRFFISIYSFSIVVDVSCIWECTLVCIQNFPHPIWYLSLSSQGDATYLDYWERERRFEKSLVRTPLETNAQCTFYTIVMKVYLQKKFSIQYMQYIFLYNFFFDFFSIFIPHVCVCIYYVWKTFWFYSLYGMNRNFSIIVDSILHFFLLFISFWSWHGLKSQ